MKILFVGDGSNFHNTLACALREMGHDAVVVSDGSRWMDTARDVNLMRGPGRLGAVHYVLDVLRLLPKMRGFDIVHIVNPIFIHLRPEKVRLVFDYLKRHNSHVFLSAIGTDYEYVRACYDHHTFRYSDYLIGDKITPYMQSAESRGQDNWRQPFMARHSKHIIENVDGIMACLYEYYEAYRTVAPEKLCYGGIPIDTKNIEARIISSVPDRVRFFLGIQRDRTLLKGTDRLLAALRRVHERHPDKCEMCVVENLPYKEYVERMQSSHVLLDQIYSYTPATNALVAMARGLVAVSGAEPEYYDLIGEQENRPIVNALPYSDDDLVAALERIIEERDRLPQLSQMSRKFVEKHNDSRIVARRHIDFWNKMINENKQER